jgi:hypothetical protein
MCWRMKLVMWAPSGGVLLSFIFCVNGLEVLVGANQRVYFARLQGVNLPGW